jgi:hypothetical protein
MNQTGLKIRRYLLDVFSFSDFHPAKRKGKKPLKTSNSIVCTVYPQFDWLWIV